MGTVCLACLGRIYISMEVFQYLNMPKAILQCCVIMYCTISDFMTHNGDKVTMNILMTL